jgi:hypothetical protein
MAEWRWLVKLSPGEKSLLFRNKQPPVTIPEFQNTAVTSLKSIYSLYTCQILIKIDLYGKKGHPVDTTEQTYKNRIWEKERRKYEQQNRNLHRKIKNKI